MQDGFVKIAAATPALRVADCAYNASEIVRLAEQAADKGARLIVFPELCLTGYTCGDLFLQQTLLDGALEALRTVRDATAALNAAVVVGLPLMHQCKLYNVAAVLCRGAVEGLVPKHSIPNYSEFYEQRHFTSGAGLDMEPVELLGQTTMFGGLQRGDAGFRVWRGDLRGPVGTRTALHAAGAGGRDRDRQPVRVG